MSKKPSATNQIIALCNSLTQAVEELQKSISKLDENARVQYADLCNRSDQLEGKIAAVAKGRRTAGTRAAGTGAAGGAKSTTTETPKGPKPYSNSMYYFKGEYAKDPAKIKSAYCTKEMLEAMDDHCNSDEKIKSTSGDRRAKAEAAWLWNTYVKAAKGDEDDVKKTKTDIREAVKRDYTAHKQTITKENNTPAAKEGSASTPDEDDDAETPDDDE